MTRIGFLTRAAVGALIVLLLAEAVLATIDRKLPEPVEWYNPLAQAKAVQIERLARSEAADVVFVGPSTVFRGIDPDMFERRDPLRREAYNAGLTGGFPPIMRRWVTEEVLPKLQPRTVVYGLSSLDFHDRIFRGSVDAYRTALATRKGTLAATERLAARYSRLFRYRRLFQDPTEYTYIRRVVAGKAPGRVEREIRTLSEDGFRPKQDVDRDRRDTDRAILRRFQVGPRGTKDVTRLVRYLQRRDIDVVFVEMPVPRRWRALHPRGDADHRRFERHLRSLAHELSVPLLRPPEGLTRSRLFADNLHMNRRGARELTRWLVSRLATR